jgi:hypothetical protein
MSRRVRTGTARSREIAEDAEWRRLERLIVEDAEARFWSAAAAEIAEDAEARFLSAAVGAGFHRLVLDWLLDDDIPLSDDFRHYIAEELELAWFKTPQQRRLLRGKWRREGVANGLRLQIQHIAQRDGISKTKAKEKIADSKGVTVEALNQALWRTPISGKSRKKK